MAAFKIHDETGAPEEARDILKNARENYAFLPNLLGALAESPAALEAYTTLNSIYEKTDLDAKERQILFLAISHENACHYCMAAHSAIATQSGLDEETLKALRDGAPLPDAKQNALAEFARKIVRERGHLGEGDVDAFLQAGYTRANVFDVLLANATKTLSNYANHIAETPVDTAFDSFTWSNKAAE